MLAKSSSALGFALGVSLVGVCRADAQKLAPGSAAPPLDIKAWYKGKPISALDKNKTYVIEFWATWCGPCRSAMPHLSRLARANKDVTFIGVGIWEPHNKALLKKFVDGMGSDMDYNVGYSGDRDSGMGITWMQAANQTGIPATFVVKNSQIQWIGHPGRLEKPLAEIKAGTFDLNASKAEFAKAISDGMDLEAAKKEIAIIRKLIVSKMFEEANSKIIGLESRFPSLASRIADLRFALAANENPDRWEKESRQKLGRDPDIDTRLTMFAMDCVRVKNIPLGERAIKLTLEKPTGNITAVLYNAAFFYDGAGDYKKALSLIERAFESIATNPYRNDPSFADFKQMLEKMKADLTEKIKRAG